MPVVIRRIVVVLLVLVAGLLPVVAAAAALRGERSGAGGAVAAQDDGDRGVQPESGIQGAVVTQTRTFTVHLPVIFNSSLTISHDMVDFLVGDDRLFEVQHSGGSQARHQTQVEAQAFFHTKGNEISAEWEELWADSGFIYRGTDTSPGNGQYYTLRDPGMYGSKWAPRYWEVGDVYERNPQVTFYDKQSCMPAQGGTQRSFLRFEAHYDEYTFQSGITLENVVELAWLLQENGQAIERYFYAENYGLVGWTSNSGAHSYISEIHAPGTRPDNLREIIPCLDKSAAVPAQFMGPLVVWPGEHRR